MRNGARLKKFPLLLLFLILVLALFLLTTAFGDLVYASSFGPDDGFNGDPTNGLDCTVCHFDFPVNSGDGAVALTGLPAAFVPGTTYNLLATLQDVGQQRWGFEVSVLNGSNQQAGDLTVTDAVNTQLSDNPGVFADYMKQTFDGTYWPTPDGPVQWAFDWVAPNASSVTFYIAGNAANGSEDPSGDYIYTQQYTLTQATTSTEITSWGKIKALYRP